MPINELIAILLLMALSKQRDLSVALIEWYSFYLVFQKYGIAVPENASWKEMDNVPAFNDHKQICQEVPNMLFEIADLFENARVEELVKKYERLRLNSGNLYNHFTKTISTLLDNGLTWGKVVMFFSFAVSFAIYLCTNEMSHLAGRVCVWTAQDLQNRIQPWIDVNGGWESLLQFGKKALSHKDNELKKKEIVKRLGQVSLMLGVFAVAAFAVKQIFT